MINEQKPKDFVNQPVTVHYNFHKKCWSVTLLNTGLVIFHANWVVLEDAFFKVSEAGMERVLKEQRKNVHAKVRGFLRAVGPAYGPHKTSISKPAEQLTGTKVRYNPYDEIPYFVDSKGRPVDQARLVVFNDDNKVYARRIIYHKTAG